MKASYREIEQCRVCGNPNLISALDLGEQYLTGVFPRQRDETLSGGPLELVVCHADEPGTVCGLVQLKQTYNLSELYGLNYGYRSSLNRSMVNHLAAKIKHLREFVQVNEGDLIVDIGSNDGTSLSFYPETGLTLLGVDPTIKKFGHYYRPDIIKVPEFFSDTTVQNVVGDRKARIVTSIAMFYDLERPLVFAQHIFNILADDGIWHFEQGYSARLPEETAYDSICHEHLEYYGLHQVRWIVEHAGFKIVELEFNEVNGGSFAVTVAKKTAPYKEATSTIEKVLASEREAKLTDLATFEKLKVDVNAHRDKLTRLLHSLKAEGKKVLGYGASTKGNVILQYCQFTENDLECMAEVNSDKFGCFTPGSWIPITSEADAKSRKPDYFLVMPWHFRKGILEREQEFLKSGGKFIFPLPEIEIVSADGVERWQG